MPRSSPHSSSKKVYPTILPHVSLPTSTLPPSPPTAPTIRFNGTPKGSSTLRDVMTRWEAELRRRIAAAEEGEILSTPGPVTLVWSVVSPGLVGAVAPVTLTWSLNNAIASLEADVVRPSPVTLTWSIVTPVVVSQGTLTVTPTPLMLTWSIRTPNVIGAVSAFTPERTIRGRGRPRLIIRRIAPLDDPVILGAPRRITGRAATPIRRKPMPV